MGGEPEDCCGPSRERSPAFPAALEAREARLEPFDWYREMRRESPVRYDSRRRVWDVFRYVTVESILRDSGTFSSDRDPGADGPPSMLSSDPPTHTRLRSPVEGRFVPGEVAALEPEVRAMAEELVDAAVAGRGRLDVVDDLARWLPTMTVAALLGIPPEERETFKTWSDTLVAGPRLTGGDRERLAERQADAGRGMREYFSAVIDRRSAEPRDDLVSAVLAEGGGELSTSEVRGIAELLLIAGNVTTTSLVGNAVWCFASQGVVEDVAGDDALLESAIEEVLRYRSPVQWTTRIATEPVAVDGHEVAEGDRIRTWIGSANRDPERFDAP